MTKIEKDRMRTMIEGLRKLPKERFDFSRVVVHGTPCGTVGCAMGWAPAFLPELIEWTGDDCLGLNQGDGLRMDGSMVEYNQAAAKLFGLEGRMAIDLFSPNEDASYAYEEVFSYIKNPIHPYLPVLTESASPKKVADLLDRFLELVEKGEITTLNEDEVCSH